VEEGSMKIPKELIDQWVNEASLKAPLGGMSEYIAQRAAEWALSQPVSMEPVAWTGIRASIPHLTSSRAIAERESDLYTNPLYTATQLAAARQQGAEEERKNAHVWVAGIVEQRIAELERTNAVLLEALKLAEAALSDIGDAEREPDDDVAWCEARAAQAIPQARAAIAEVKP